MISFIPSSDPLKSFQKRKQEEQKPHSCVLFTYSTVVEGLRDSWKGKLSQILNGQNRRILTFCNKTPLERKKKKCFSFYVWISNRIKSQHLLKRKNGIQNFSLYCKIYLGTEKKYLYFWKMLRKIGSFLLWTQNYKVCTVKTKLRVDS